MQIDVRGRHLRLTAALEEHVARRLRFALGRFAGRLRRVTVRLADVNGPGGGADKLCYVRLDLDGRAIMIEEFDRDLYVAVDRAAERAGRAAARAVARARAA